MTGENRYQNLSFGVLKKSMQILYRISSNSYKKERLPIATKEYCLKNFIENVLTSDDFMTIMADSVDQELGGFISQFESNNIKIMPINLRSNGASFRFQLEYVRSLELNEVVMFQEDDYIYKAPSWPYGLSSKYSKMIERALKFADYISLYDHPDKYLPPEAGGNKLVSPEGTEKTEIFCTADSHWKYTNSTTCTFAARVETILKDAKIWHEFCKTDHPYDFQAFLALGCKGRKIATAIPGRATHADIGWISPFFDIKQITFREQINR